MVGLQGPALVVLRALGQFAGVVCRRAFRCKHALFFHVKEWISCLSVIQSEKQSMPED